MKAIDPVTWHQIQEAARVYEIELRPSEGRFRLNVRSPQGAANLLRFYRQVQPWLFINLVFVPDSDEQYMEFGAELLPR